MILTYKDCIAKYGNAYRVKKAKKLNKIIKLAPGIYSTNAKSSKTVALAKKHSKAVFAGEYAFYLHGLTDVVPEKYFLATPSKAAKISDAEVKQLYVRDNIFELGIEEMEIDDDKIKIYSKERMLLELLRNKNTIPPDLYKEIVNNYRRIIHTLRFRQIEEYLRLFPKQKKISKALREEIL